MSYTSADKSALKVFVRRPVSSDMVNYLVSTTKSVVRVKPKVQKYTNSYPSPPSTPLDPYSSKAQPMTLTNFIENLIRYSNVQTPTLMSTLVYLTRLRSILPASSYGIETTRHRVFLGCLILAAKNLNDSSPLNKHWTQYTDGLLSLKEVNTIEREMLSYLNWDLRITNTDLINCFAAFLQPIKAKLRSESNRSLMKLTQQQEKNYLKPIANSSSQSSMNSAHSQSSVPGLMSSSSSNTIASTTSSIPTPSSSLHQLNQLTDTILATSPSNVKNSDFQPRPLRLRSSNDNLTNLINANAEIMKKRVSSNPIGKENDIRIADRSSRGFSFLGSGRIVS